MHVSGGYIIHANPLVRSGMNAHTSVLDRPISQLDLDAVNEVQETAWRISRPVLDVMLTCWEQGLPLGGLSVEPLKELPARMGDEVWEGMSEDDKKVHRKLLGEIHSHNASSEGRQRSLLDTLSVAQDLMEQPAIYYPHSRCFRGRIHPLACVGPQPQGSDHQKGVLEFAHGEPLGQDGLYWLMIRAAGCAGQDKLPLADRVAWVLAHMEEICMSASDPIGYTWWASEEHDEPWGLLATCFELAQVDLEHPEGFISHLPVPLDGSCNGLQHLSAMALDPVGARATNLCRDTDRQDIYMEVCKIVRELVERDAAAGKAEALLWHGKVTRKTVKRAVMTTPYGVTDGGIRSQLINDKLVPESDDKSLNGPAAEYLRDCLVIALGRTVVSARSIMAWLQTTANSLATAGLPFEWKSPSGSTVRQAYFVTSTTRVDTLVGRLSIENEVKESTLNPRKQALAAAPNVIHSFDAAHLSLTVNAAYAAGIRSFAMIHDSYGTHAGRTTCLAGLLRETFVSIYEADWLGQIAAYVLTYAPKGFELPPLPTRGNFDVTQVVAAPFFFS
jgi:DNA-directed RNA polymerase